jgi:hypothetical protein
VRLPRRTYVGRCVSTDTVCLPTMTQERVPDREDVSVAGHQDRPSLGERADHDLVQRLERLPPGHPSSPYNEDGTRKPPVARPVDRELPLPDGRDADAEPTSTRWPPEASPDQESSGTQDLPLRPEPPGPEASLSDSRSWEKALSHLKEQWARHEERWPREQRPQIDRSNDEPGSWRGEGDQYLDAEENLVAGHALERIRPIEEKVSAALHEIKAEVPGCDLVGLEFSLKGEERFKEKVSDELHAKPDRSIAEISENMPDVVRYTFQFDRQDYVQGYWNVHGCMERHSYEIEFSRNSWDSLQYKGINSRWRTPTGQLFEVQFHTPESFEAKQLTHKAYENIRTSTASDQERGELYAFQSEVSASVPIPIGSLTIPDYSKKEA